jgi:superfamily II DNA or RNA helicase
LILVDKLDLLNQWRKELAHWLDVSIDSIGQIGDGKWKEGARITVATVQTLRKRKPKDSWFDHWDCVILDECHHVTAETIRDILYQFSAKYRFGVSATTDRKDDKFGFALAVLGEVFHQDDEEALRDAGVLVRPHVKVVKTRFEHDYWPDHQSDEEDECQVPKCPFSGKRPHFHRNNYHAVKTALVNDEHRNALVIGHVMREISKGDHHHLIITNEIKHLELLRERFGVHPVFVRPVPVFTLTGQIKGRERAEIVAAIERVPAAVIFATVAKEGLDIPQIDRIYLPFPESNPKSTQQKIGRGTRIHEGKQDSIVFDFFDINVSVFRKQFRNRRFQCYDQLGMEVDLG